MEVGAVKQAFNNEVIQLKKNLNQAKIQVIHKLTRKAKTLTEKKCPEHLKEKNKKKAESAVREVLIMKKLKPRDIAGFIITYKGDLNSHLNKPTVDSDKACARLLLHKSLQQKYKSIKDRFGDIPIKDLLMSRQERRKLKKEARDTQKNKKKGKDKVVNSAGDWSVEDVVVGDDRNEIEKDDSKETSKEDGSDEESQANDDMSDEDCDNDGNNDGNDSNDSQDISDEDDDNTPVTREVVNGSDESSDEQSVGDDLELDGSDSNDEKMDKDSSGDEGQNNDDEEIETGNIVKLNKQTNIKTTKLMSKHLQPVPASIEEVLSKLKPKKKPDKKVKENKNKNLNEKMLKRKFKQNTDDSKNAATIVDPFFKTATGASYMSVAEPRQPDEVKEIHRQGNRQERRAAMFGRAPIRPRRDDRQNFRKDKFNYKNGSNDSNSNDKRAKYNDRNSNYNGGNTKFNNRNSNLNDNNSKFNGRNSNFNDRNSNFNGRSSNSSGNNLSNNKVVEPKEEKLHPSWEAKKKQSGILPFKGKKIVFDEN